MKTTGRFAVVLGVIAAAFFAVLLVSSAVHAQHTGTGMVLPSSGGGLDTAAGDARYLMLDASNDPLTGDLSITGEFLGSAGAVGAPSISFSGDTDTGLYSSASNTLDVAAGGTNVGTFTSAGLTLPASTSAAAPFLNFSGTGTNSGVAYYDSGAQKTLYLRLNGSTVFSAATTAYTLMPSYYVMPTSAWGIYGDGSIQMFATSSSLRIYGDYAGANLNFIATNADGTGDTALAVGSRAVAGGQTMFAVCADCDGTPSYLMKVESAGEARFSAGTAASPALSFLLDPDTGIYNSAANTLDFAANGAKSASISTAGLLPGADNSFNLGSSTLSWADFFTKYISDQAGANRITLNEASYTTFATGQAATAGADVAYYFDVAGNYANADSHTRWRDNGTTLLMELTGTGTLELGSGSALEPIIAYATDDRTGMFFPSTSSVAFSQQGVEMARFDSTGLLLDATGPNYVRTAASSSGALGIFSGADASTEVAVLIGTSDAIGSGEYLASFCLDCDGTPNEVARVESDGDVQLDGIVQADGGVKISSSGNTITESHSVSTGSVDFPSISADTCGEKTLTVTGADVNSPVACSWPAGLEANLIGMCFVSAADTVTLRLCNMTAVSIDPAAATFGARTFKD